MAHDHLNGPEVHVDTNKRLVKVLDRRLRPFQEDDLHFLPIPSLKGFNLSPRASIKVPNMLPCSERWVSSRSFMRSPFIRCAHSMKFTWRYPFRALLELFHRPRGEIKGEEGHQDNAQHACLSPKVSEENRPQHMILGHPDGRKDPLEAMTPSNQVAQMGKCSS